MPAATFRSRDATVWRAPRGRSRLRVPPGWPLRPLDWRGCPARTAPSQVDWPLVPRRRRRGTAGPARACRGSCATGRSTCRPGRRCPPPPGTASAPLPLQRPQAATSDRPAAVHRRRSASASAARAAEASGAMPAATFRSRDATRLARASGSISAARSARVAAAATRLARLSSEDCTQSGGLSAGAPPSAMRNRRPSACLQGILRDGQEHL